MTGVVKERYANLTEEDLKYVEDRKKNCMAGYRKGWT